MASCCIQLINPNTSRAMTDRIHWAARRVAAPGTEIMAVCPAEGVPSVEGHFDEAVAALGVLQLVKQGRAQGVSGHVIACFGDPGCWRPGNWPARRWWASPRRQCIWPPWWPPAFRW